MKVNIRKAADWIIDGMRLNDEEDETGNSRDEEVYSSKRLELKKEKIKNGKPINVYYLSPFKFEHSQNICDKMLEQTVIVVDFHDMARISMHVWQRVIDFIYGAAYVMDVDIKAISKYVYVFIPRDIILSDEEIQKIVDDNISR